jgi:hypothetical protein
MRQPTHQRPLMCTCEHWKLMSTLLHIMPVFILGALAGILTVICISAAIALAEWLGITDQFQGPDLLAEHAARPIDDFPAELRAIFLDPEEVLPMYACSKRPPVKEKKCPAPRPGERKSLTRPHLYAASIDRCVELVSAMTESKGRTYALQL